MSSNQDTPEIPLRRESFRQELAVISQWYNGHRPHVTLSGQTANEVYEKRFPANRKPRIEPRPRWPRGSPWAQPWALVGGKPEQLFETTVRFHNKRRRRLPCTPKQRSTTAESPDFVKNGCTELDHADRVAPVSFLHDRR